MGPRNEIGEINEITKRPGGGLEAGPTNEIDEINEITKRPGGCPELDGEGASATARFTFAISQISDISFRGSQSQGGSTDEIGDIYEITKRSGGGLQRLLTSQTSIRQLEQYRNKRNYENYENGGFV